MTLPLLRKRIDRIDSQLLALLNRRARLAVQVGAIKRRAGTRFFDPVRERQILQRLIDANRGPLSRAAVRLIYREILRQTRRVEQTV